ncbi:FlgO family outer membrane protein [Aliifodinibius sp. S!AR15-10]|uniref:FlgO family outer membrane protein n=1 Tax=Aliifodinibius sp. S!AR15-10 TaxID=2950437 RepID=UPI002855DABC|nr:FlgO family outer membrane protein [Aliifodinibius sp. S!AR15-10]MDR8393225.1 FlgO family outer membrane protein [Aliifodinibius sp. S!AR15-10]
MKLEKIDHYDIHQKLGSGSQGTVYLATDTKLMRPVVIKIVHPERAWEKRVRLKILEEARLASAIQHPNVCAIYEVSEYEKRPYMVMQHVPGKTLKELIQKEPLNLRFALSIGIQISEGLAEAHKMGILHRDLKPANIMITEAGLVKILDFGLARRRRDEEEEPKPVHESEFGFTAHQNGQGSQTNQMGTIAYMAPELFVTRRSTEHSDIFSLGVILYEIITGRHPFWVPESAGQGGLIHQIKNTEPIRPQTLRDDVPESMQNVILKALDKQPSNRFKSVTEIYEALKTIMKSMDFEVGTVPGEHSAVLPTPAPKSQSENRQRTSLLSKLTDFFDQSENKEAPKNSIAVLPFKQAEEATNQQNRYFGLAMADAIANRLAQNTSVRVRPPGAFLSLTNRNLDEIQVGHQLESEYILTGSYFRSDEGFNLNWQLLEVADKSIAAGSTIKVPSFDLVKVQSDITDEVEQALFNLENLDMEEPEEESESLPDQVSEEYLEARALLSRFLWGSSNQRDLEESKKKFKTVLQKAPDFAPAHAGLGRVHLNYVVNGFGGHTHFMAAQRHLEKALEIDKTNVEAKLQRAYTYLWRGEKEQARRDIQVLLKRTKHDAEVFLGAGIIFQLDGIYDDALRLFGMALQNNPTAATQIYNRRARVYHYMGELDKAWQQVEKGLSLEPDQSLLRTTKGYLYFRNGEYKKAITILESVIKKEPSRRMSYPTLAMCYVKNGDPDKAAELITDELLAISATDCEMAYRMATYCVVEGNKSEALHWLRKTIYLGYENYPWITSNPAWSSLHDHPEFQKVTSDLKRVHETNRNKWKMFMEDFWDK